MEGRFSETIIKETLKTDEKDLIKSYLNVHLNPYIVLGCQFV